MRILAALFILSSVAVADTPPIVDIFKMKSESRTGVVTVAGGGVSNVVPGASGNVLTSDGTSWNSQVPPTAPVTSVFGRTGAVTAQSGDYTTSLVPEGSRLYWTQARLDAAFGAKTTSDLAEGSNLYYTQARFDSAFSAKSTSSLAEGSNLYYTQGRFDSAFSAKSTSNLTEGSNLYWTQARFNTALAAKTTSDLAEGSNLYFTTPRAQGAISASPPLTYASGVVGCQTASDSQAGCLSSSDHTSFSAKADSASPTFTGTITAPAGTPSTTLDIDGNIVGLVPSIKSTDSLLLTANPQTDPYSFGAELLLGSFGNSDVLLRTPSQVAYGSENSFQVLDSLALTPTLRVTSSQLQSPLSGMSTGISYYPTVNSGGTSGYTSVLVDTTELALGSGVTNLLDLRVGGVSKFVIDHNGTITTGGGSGATWGSITGTLSSQTDLQSALNAKQATGSYITALTSDVSASGPGSAAATVNSVGGSSAANVHSAELLANAATSLATANAIMRRDSGGAVSGTFNYTPTTPGDWSWTTTPTTHGGALDSIANWIKNVATNLSNLLDTRTLYVSKTALLSSDSNSCSYFLPCLTIQRGINVANGLAAYYKQVTVRVEPGTTSGAYAENLTLSQQGVNLVCDSPQTADRRCNISGTITVNLTGTSGGGQFIAASNEVYIHGFVVVSGSSDAVTFSGSTWQRLIASHCYFQATAGHSAVVSNNGFTTGTPSEFRSYDTTFENNSATVPTVLQSAGRFWLYGTTPTVQNTNASGPSYLQNPTATTTGNLASGSACIASPGSLTGIAVGQTISDTTSLVNSVNVPTGTKVLAIPGACSAGQIQMSANAAGTETSASLNFGGSSMIANITQFTGQYQLVDNTATATLNLSTIASGTAACMSTPTLPNGGYTLWSDAGCNSTNTNSITGSGVMVNGPGNARFGSSGDIVSTVTQVSLGPGLPQGEIMIGPGATTGTNVALSIKDAHIKAAQTTAPTTTLSGNAGTGGTPACTVAHTVDMAGVLTLKTGTASWASGTQCTLNFNKAWGVAPVCVWSPANASAASKSVTQQINFPATATGTATVNFGAADTAQTTYIWQFHCVETQ